MLSVNGVALITGAASGIGAATAVAFAAHGCSGLFLTDVNEAALAAVADRAKAAATNKNLKVAIKRVDVTKEQECEDMVKSCVAELGRLDYACNIAGILGDADLAGTPITTANESMADFDRVHSVNARGVLLCLKAELNAMRAQQPQTPIAGRPGTRGSIVNLASIAGIVALMGGTSYGCSKHACIGITKNAAAAHASDLIRVNAVCPGFIDTPLIASMGKTGLQGVAERTMMQRLGMPEEIGDACVFLCSANASFVTGHSLVVDGGATVVY